MLSTRGTTRLALPTPQPLPPESVRFDRIRRVFNVPANRSGVRFAITIVAVDLLVLALFGESSASILAALAVCIHLYFFDFDGDFGERFIGHAVATFVGAAAVALGVICASPLWLAVVVTSLVSSAFAYLRLLRGYVSRSAVGLQGAFFFPLMISAHFDDLSSLLCGWSIGSGLSIIAALVVVPHRRSGQVRVLLASWLRAAGDLSRTVGAGEDPTPTVTALKASRDELLDHVTGSFSQPGAVGRRQRALAGMVSGARWSIPVAERLTTKQVTDASKLAETTALAFQAAADLVESGSLPSDLPDLPTARRNDLDLLSDQSPEFLASHYPIRVLSIGAMNQLYQAALSRRMNAPTPDIGHFDAMRPSRILRQNFRWKSLWLRNALRTGFGAAACVLIVRVVGLDHGLWVVLAALAVTQVTLSGATGAQAMLKMAAGATGGVLIAGSLAMLHLPYPVFLCALPVAAFLAKRVAGSNMTLAQLSYTQFALINFAVVTWPPNKGLEGARFQDILLGAAVAAGFSLLVFPSGVMSLLHRLRADSLESARRYLTASIYRVTEPSAGAIALREELLEDLGAYENALDAAFMHSTIRSPELMLLEEASATAHDLLLGGDACAELATIAHTESGFEPVARELSEWWGEFMASTSET